MNNIIVINYDPALCYNIANMNIREKARHKSAMMLREFWRARPGDIIVVDRSFLGESFIGFLEYITTVYHFSISDLTVIDPCYISGKPGLLLDKDKYNYIVDKVRPIIQQEANYRLSPIYLTKEVLQLSEDIGLAISEKEKSFIRSGRINKFENKASFKQLLLRNNLSAPISRACTTLKQFIQAVDELIEIEGALIIKQPNNAACYGNIIISKDKVKISGAFESYFLHGKSNQEITNIHSMVWQKLAAQENEVLVEVYHKDSKILTADVDISSDRLRFSYGEAIMSPEVWIGIDIPGIYAGVSSYNQKKMLDLSLQIAGLLKDHGYKGNINLDFILTDKEELMLIEANCRTSGLTYIDAIANRLLGDEYQNHHYLINKNNLLIKNISSFSELLDKLDKSRLLYDGAAKEGVLVVSEDIKATNKFSYLIIAANKSSAVSIEKKMYAELSAS